VQTTDNTIICRPCSTVRLRIYSEYTHVTDCMYVCVYAFVCPIQSYTQFIPINIAELLPNVKYKYTSKHTYNATTNIRI